MRKIAKKLILKNIIKILRIYQNSLDNDKLIFKNYLDQTIYFEIQHLIRLIKERNEKNEI